MIDLSKQEELKTKGAHFCEDAEHYAAINANSMALEYLSHAENIFISINDLHWLIYIQHQKMKVYSQLEQYEKALEILPEITSGYLKNKNYKNLALSLILGAEIYYKTDDFIEAKSHFKIAENLIFIKNLEDLKNLIYCNLSLLYLDQKLHLDAIEYLNKAKLLNSNQDGELGWIEEQLGLAYMELFLFDKAEAEYKLSYQKYLKIQDYNSASRVMNQLIIYYDAKEKVNQAKALKEKMIQINNLAIAKKI